MSTQAKSSKVMIAPLTSARFIAALYVVLGHTLFVSGWTIPLWVQPILGLSETAVSFFFVLSGYILAVVYLKAGKPVEKKRFYVARIARVYPLFLLSLLVDVPHLLLARVAKYGWPQAIEKTGVTLSMCSLMLHGWSTSFGGLNFPSWSLSDEAFFYLVFPVAGFMLWRLTPRLSLVAMGLIYCYALSFTLLLHRDGVSDVLTYTFPALRVCDFLLGILLAKVHLSALSREGVADRIDRIAMPLFAVCLVCFIGVCYEAYRIPHAVVRGVLLAPLHLGFVLALASRSRSIQALFSSRVGLLLGEASFALYLLHIPLWNLFGMLHWTGMKIMYPLYLLCGIGLSILSFLYFEAPVRTKVLRAFARGDAEGLVRSSLAE